MLDDEFTPVDAQSIDHDKMPNIDEEEEDEEEMKTFDDAFRQKQKEGKKLQQDFEERAR